MPEFALPPTVIPVDCHYTGRGKAACFLIVEDGRAAFVDNNTSKALPYLIAALEANNLTTQDVEYAIVTHVHLDHAGGTAALLERCPRAAVLAHPKAARHLVDPSRLAAGARSVYGEDFDTLYGEIRGVPEDRVRVVEDEEVLRWGSRRLRFFHTLGHASHHVCIHDDKSNGVFTGDSFGLALNWMVRPGPPFAVATTAPPDFDPEEARKSARRIVGTGADYAYLPHFGVHQNLERHAEMLERSIGQMEAIVPAAAAQELEGAALQRFCQQRVRAAMEEQLAWCGVDDPEADLAWLGEDIAINAMGLAHCA